MKRILAVTAVSLSMLLMASVAQAQMAGPGGGMTNSPGMMGGGKMMPGMGNCACMGQSAGMMCGGMLMRGRMMGLMMHGMMEKGAMMAGIPELTPGMRRAFMRSMMKTMIRSTLQTPEIKSFLDRTVTLRRDLVLKRFEYFEAFRNPKTTPARLRRLKDEMMALAKRIDKQMHQAAPAPAAK